MKSVFKQLAATALLAVTAVAQDALRVETPTGAVVCRPVLITWSGGEPPYFLSVLPGNQPTAPALVDFGTIESGNTFRWVVNIEAGTSLGLNLRDSTGTLVQSGVFEVQDGPDTSCVGQEPSGSPSGSGAPSSASGSSSSGSGSGSTSSARPTSTPPTTSSSRPTGTSASRTSSASAGASSAPAGDDDSAAAGKYVPAALAGLAGAAAVLLA